MASARDIRTIWRGHLPPLPAPTRNPPDLNNLGQCNFFELLTLMGEYPQDAAAIYRWHQGANGLWAGDQSFSDENELVRWHEARNPGVNPPFTRARVDATLATHHMPLFWLVRTNKIHALNALRQANLFNPLGWGADATTFLREAIDQRGPNGQLRAELSIHWILHAAHDDVAFGQQFVESNLTVQGNVARAKSHFNYLIQYTPYTIFKQWLSFLVRGQGQQPLNAGGLVNNHSQRILCRQVTKKFADDLRVQHGLDLGAVPSSNSGNVWHFAVENRHADFLDSVAMSRNAHMLKNLLSGQRVAPLGYARVLNKYAHFAKLLEHGASPWQEILVEIGELNPIKNKWFRALIRNYRNINPVPAGGIVAGGTLIHDVINALESKLRAVSNNIRFTARDRARERRKLTKRAKEMISFIRKGSRFGRPSLATMDRGQNTAMGLARQLGFHELEDSLQVNVMPLMAVPPIPPVNNQLPAPPTPANPVPAAGHRYYLRRPSRLG